MTVILAPDSTAVRYYSKTVVDSFCGYARDSLQPLPEWNAFQIHPPGFLKTSHEVFGTDAP